MIQKVWLVFFDENDKIISERYLQDVVPENIVKNVAEVFEETHIEYAKQEARKLAKTILNSCG